MSGYVSDVEERVKRKYNEKNQQDFITGSKECTRTPYSVYMRIICFEMM